MAKNLSSASECFMSGATATFGLENKASISSIETPCFWHFWQFPIGIQETHEFLKAMLPQTKVALDEGVRGRGEGIVARTNSRSTIAKLRFEDYERHAKRCVK